MRKLLAAIFFSVSLASGARALELDFAGAGHKAAPAPAAAAPAELPGTRTAKEWTVMVFINGKNDLEMAGLYNMNQMEMVGSDANINIVVEYGRMNGQAGDTAEDGNWTGVRRYFVTRDADPNKVTSKVVQNDSYADMGDYRRAVDFVKWAKKNYPARRYMLVLWDHGSGWMDPKKAKGDAKGISFDDETGNYIRTKQIGQILREAGPVDLLDFDACLMQMGEVAYEVKDYTKVIVGSEELVPGMGHPYGMYLDVLAQKPTMSTEELGAYIVECFYKFYEYHKNPVQLSAIRSAKLNMLATKTREFAQLALNANDPAALKAAKAGVIRYDALGEQTDPKMTLSFYGDLHQFAGLVAANLKPGNMYASSLKSKAADLQKFIDNELVIYNRAYGKNRVGRPLSESRGISVYLAPADEKLPQAALEGIFEGGYNNFEFSKVTGWHQFVTAMYGAPQPPPLPQQ
jgi:hypothetical protein